MNDEDLGAKAAAILADDVASAPPPPQPGVQSTALGDATDWRSMDDIQARDEWIALRKWVEWFAIRYDVPVSAVPNCWWQHAQLVEELSALHCSHRAAFDPADTGNGPIMWHERLSLAMPRLTRAGAGCSSEHHSLRPRSFSGVTDEGAWDAWINQTHAH